MVLVVLDGSGGASRPGMGKPRICKLYPSTLSPPTFSTRAAASRKHHDHLMPGAPCNISTNDDSLRPVVLDAANFYNNQSNDAFLFRPSDVLAAQRQVAGTGNGTSVVQQPTTRKCLNFLFVVFRWSRASNTWWTWSYLEPSAPKEPPSTSPAATSSLQGRSTR